MNDIEISRKSFRKEVKSDDEQVFMLDEIPKITRYLVEHPDMVNLGILLLFKTGLRIGELSALKKYGSILLDEGVAESTVLSQMGHTDIRTTKDHYYRNRRNAGQIQRELDKVSGFE